MTHFMDEELSLWLNSPYFALTALKASITF
jgi:hypothetical protein